MLTLEIQAELALKSDETPVGCVFVHDGKVIARGMNGTNISMNVRLHCPLWGIFIQPTSDTQHPSLLRYLHVYSY